MRSLARLSFVASLVVCPCVAQTIHWNTGEYAGFNRLDTAGDIDGDGLTDVVVGYTFSSSPPLVRLLSGRDGATLVEWPSPQFGYFGTAVAGPGDLDGDGVPDAAYHRQLTQHDGELELNSVVVRSGATGAQIHSLVGTANNDLFGHKMAAIGDVDGDGRGDLLIGAAQVTTTGWFAGAAFVYSGATGAVLLSLYGNHDLEQLGYLVTGAGDCDADGTPDFVVGRGNPSSHVDVYSGATFAKLHTLTGPSVFSSAWGRAVAGIGDADANGHADLAIADEWETVDGMQNAGRVFVHDGASGALILSVGGANPGAFLGRTLAANGDLNGDGRADFLASHRINTFPSTPSALYGEVRIFSGANGAQLAKFGQLGQPLGTFGNALRTISDNDGDGIREIAVLNPPQVWSPLPTVAGIHEFGSGTPGCAGGHALRSNLPAQIPQPGFQMLGDNAPSFGAGFLALTATHNFASADPYGLGAATYALPGTPFLVFAIHADANGDSAVPVPIPNQPGLAGSGLVAQEFWLWLGGPCQPGAIGVSTSRGLFVSLQP